MGIGMDLRDGDLAYRINFATADWPEILDRRVGRDLSSPEAHELAAEVNSQLSLPGATFDLRATIEHRGALVIRATDGQRLSAEVSNTDPAYRREGHLGVALETFEPKVVVCAALDDDPASVRAASLTNAFVEGSAKILDASRVNTLRRNRGRLAANLILTRDAGDHRPRVQPIRERFGLTWGCFVEMPVEKGIALALGMEPVTAPRLDALGTGQMAEELYAAWAKLACDALEEFQALYVHIKGPDVPAHDGKALTKRDVIETIDRGFFSVVLERLNLDRTVVAVTGDHSTSCLRMAHTADPVPLLVSGAGVASDGSRSFGETSCAQGSLGQLLGPQILPRLAILVRG
jgi:2,3-bisphosphoglycerate-independent phosphoglycerate mutase